MKYIYTLAMVMVMGLCMATSSIAADWNFYGSARITTFYTDDENLDPTLNFGLQGNSRFGANVKVSDTLGARFEYGASNNKANIRVFYGTWNFGEGELIIGQTYAPIWLSVSNQAFSGDNGLAGWGENYAGRVPQLQLKFPNFKISLVRANNKYYRLDTDNAPVKTRYTEVDFPGIQAKYKFDFDPLDFTLSAAYQTFDARKSEVESYLFAGRIGYNAGHFSFKASGFFGSNMGNIAELNVSGMTGRRGYAIVENSGVVDVDAHGYAVVAGYTATDWLKFEAGYGYAEAEADAQNAQRDEVMSYYLQSTLTLAPGVVLVPEVGMVDYKDGGQRDATYYGIKWQINF